MSSHADLSYSRDYVRELVTEVNRLMAENQQLRESEAEWQRRGDLSVKLRAENQQLREELAKIADIGIDKSVEHRAARVSMTALARLALAAVGEE
jgi:regulator of replication initiation timing